MAQTRQIINILCYISLLYKSSREYNKICIYLSKRKQRAESPINSGIALLSPRNNVCFSLTGLFHFIKIGETNV
jgi:hypothetical protein